MKSELQEQMNQGLDEARRGETVLAQIHLEKVLQQSRHPEVLAWYGFCLARNKGAFIQGIELCKEALRAAPDSPDIYLATGRIYLLAGRRRSAISAFNKGLKMGRSDAIVGQLQRIGLRRKPLFSFLDRDHFLNVYVGLLLSYLKSR
ncbi:MAG: hypothetical protein C0618_04825 [Desulfuromonas sp.]|nr:MAG: hypothetical protein C0618_04825 [Desulfuromonas sp.]